MAYENIMELLSALDSIKHLKRTGWVKLGVPEPETVACHMYRMAVLALSLEGQIEGLNISHAVAMCLLHDLSEAIVGDITPHCGISDEEKYDLENQAIQKIASFVPVSAVGENWVLLWREYEAQDTLEARVVKHLDKFDMVVQAFEYEQKYGGLGLCLKCHGQLKAFPGLAIHCPLSPIDYCINPGLDLGQFFDSTKTAFSMSPFVEWDLELRCRRSQWLEANKIITK